MTACFSFVILQSSFILSLFCVNIGQSWRINGDDYNANFGTVRISRKAVIVTSLINSGSVYRIENERASLYLTARNGLESPGESFLKKWSNNLSQLWEASKIDKGYILKPLRNEFNSITSQIEHNAHSYITYDFKNLGNGSWHIKNVVTSLCVAYEGDQIKNVNCNNRDKGQIWKFHLDVKK